MEITAEKKNKVYISGPISGKPIHIAEFSFLKAEKELRKKGYEPVNPFDSGLEPTDTWERHLAYDIEMLRKCKYILMLKGWESSRGAKLEREVAILNDIEVWYEKE